MRPNSHRERRLPLSRGSPPGVSYRARTARLSYRAHSAKVEWEAAHGEPCPYARPARPDLGRDGRKRRGPAAAVHNNRLTQRVRLLPEGVPDAQRQRLFGSAFVRTPSASAGHERTWFDSSSSCCAIGTVAGGAAATRTDARRGEKSTIAKDAIMAHRTAQKRRERCKTAVPTLLELHQRVIDAALREISRPRDGPFDNLGERLGGEHDTFTYCSPDDSSITNRVCSGDRSTQSLPRPSASVQKKRASTAGKRRALVRARDLPRPCTTNSPFRTQTADSSTLSTRLPRLEGHDPWKIPLLRTSWIDGGESSLSNRSDSLGGIEYDDPNPELPGRCSELGSQEGPENAAYTGAPEQQPGAAAGPPDQLKRGPNQCRSEDGVPTPQLEGIASSSAVGLPGLRAAAKENVEESMTCARARITTTLGEGRRPQAESRTRSTPIARTAASQFVDKTVAHALEGRLVEVSGKKTPIAELAEQGQSDGLRPTDEGSLEKEASIMARGRSIEYLQQGVRSRLANIVRFSGSPTPTEAGTIPTGTALPENAGRRSSVISAESRAVAHERSDEYLQQGLRASLAQIVEVASGSLTPAESGTIPAGTALREDAGRTRSAIAVASRAMAHECSDEYVREGLWASLAHIHGVASGSPTPTEERHNNTNGATLTENAGQTSRGISAESRVMAQECSDECVRQGLRASLLNILGIPSGSSTPTEARHNTITGATLPEPVCQRHDVISAESRAMAQECSVEYLRQGLRASQAHIVGVAPGSSTPTEVRHNNTTGATLSEPVCQRHSVISAESRTMAQQSSVEYLRQGLRASLAHIVGVAPGSSTPTQARHNTTGATLPEPVCQRHIVISAESSAMAQECPAEYLRQGLRASLAHIVGVAPRSSTPTEARHNTTGATLTENAGQTSRDISAESRAMAQECSAEYLGQGLRASLAHIVGVAPGSSTPTEARSNNTTATALAETLGRRNSLTPAPAPLGIKGRGFHAGGGSGTTTPLSGLTTPISTDSSSATEFVLNDDAFRETEEKGRWATISGTDQASKPQDIHSGVSTGVGQGFSSQREEAIANAAEATVEGWVLGAIGKSVCGAQPTTTPTVVEQPLAHTSDKLETAGANEDDGRSGEHRRSPVDPNQVMALPFGFLQDINERRASLKPVTTAQLTPMQVGMGGGQSEAESPMERERGVEREARGRAAALLELTTLVRAEDLDRYDPDDFSREVLFGEGRHSVVYRVSATRPHETTGRFEGHPGIRPATKTAKLREATAATMAREVSTDILAAAETAVVSMEKTSLSTAAVAEETMMSAITAAAVVESVSSAEASATVTAASLDNDDTIGTVLAAKEFRYTRADAPESILRQAHREVCMHLRVSGCVNVVALRGVWVLPRITILLEPMHGGNLHSFVRARAAENDVRNEGHETRRQRARLVAEAAQGLAALHHAGIVHRDVKSHNVLVVRPRRTAFGGAEPVVARGRERGESDKNCTCLDGIDESGWEAKLGDLGSAALTPREGQAALTEEIGTSGWTAPEVCQGRGYGTPADVFSLGVLIWDAFVCGALENPMCGRSGDQLTGDLRPRWPRPPLPIVPLDIQSLAERCWALDPEARPTAGAVVAELRAFCCRACVEVGG